MLLATDTFPQERFGLVTGSRCSSLVPKRSADVGQRTLAKWLAKERVFEFHDERNTWQTEHGKLAEQFAFEHYEKYFDNQITKGRWIAKGDIGGSTDAEADAYGVDFKCPTSLQGWLDYLEGIDDDQYNQAQLYMVLTGKPKWVIASYLIETQFMTDNGLVYPVEESKRMILNEVEASAEWVEKFNSNLPKVVELRNEYIELYKTRK
jgi:hypothetical protein